MIPKPFVFKGANVETALDQYKDQMPTYLAEFEKENGSAQVIIAAIYQSGYNHIVVAVIYQDKARMEAIEASKNITGNASGLLSQLSSRLTQAFNAEGCDHEYESGFDEDGNERIVCKKCRTPLA